jgi:hypothetical protein
MARRRRFDFDNFDALCSSMCGPPPEENRICPCDDGPAELGEDAQWCPLHDGPQEDLDVWGDPR